MSIYKRCSRCGKRIPSGSRCSCLKSRHREYDRLSRDKKSKQYYDGREWQHARESALEADQYLDVYLYMTKGEIVTADTVHHIVPIRDDWEKRNDIRNLMSLNHDTHSMIEAEYRKNKTKMQKRLQKILYEYRKILRAGGL